MSASQIQYHNEFLRTQLKYYEDQIQTYEKQMKTYEKQIQAYENQLQSKNEEIKILKNQVASVTNRPRVLYEPAPYGCYQTGIILPFHLVPAQWVVCGRTCGCRDERERDDFMGLIYFLYRVRIR
jgi:hypothetical protein